MNNQPIKLLVMKVVLCPQKKGKPVALKSCQKCENWGNLTSEHHDPRTYLHCLNKEKQKGL